jgi:S1-C subfamily serine protease
MGAFMARISFVLLVAAALITSNAFAAGPFGSIHVGNWNGGAFTDDKTGAFSHCAGVTTYASGVGVSVGQNTAGSWLIGFGHPSWRLTNGETFPIDLTFDGQAQLRLFGTAPTPNMVFAILPNIDQFRKSRLMVAVAKGQTFQFNLSSTAPLLQTIANCVAKVKSSGLANAGDFSIVPPKPAVANTRQQAVATQPPKEVTATTKQAKTIEISGTGFVVSQAGHVVTNNHVISGCVRDIRGSLPGGSEITLRVVSTDEMNDLALLQTQMEFKDVAVIRGTAVHSGDAVIAIGYPFRGLLTSDLTVTTGIVSSLSGILNDTRYLQISAPVQPGNSGGPLLDMRGNVVGVVAEKFNALKFAKLSGGTIPENINFAIKPGAVRDFLDNSVVPYKVSDLGAVELKATDIASSARAYTFLISCTGNAKE